MAKKSVKSTAEKVVLKNELTGKEKAFLFEVALSILVQSEQMRKTGVKGWIISDDKYQFVDGKLSKKQ